MLTNLPVLSQQRWARTFAVVLATALALSSQPAVATPALDEPIVTPEPQPGEVDVKIAEAVVDGSGGTAGDFPEAPNDSLGSNGDLPADSDNDLSDVERFLAGFGDVPEGEQHVVASQGSQAVDIPDPETADGSANVAPEVVHSVDIVEVNGEPRDGLVTEVTAVTLQEAVSSALGDSGIVPADTALRGDLLAPVYPRAAAGSSIEVETLPVDENALPGAAFALRLTANDPNADALWVGVELDISDFKQAYGGSFGSRLELQVFPECVLTSPERPECSTGTAVSSVNHDGLELFGVVPADAGRGPRLAGVGGYGGFHSTKVRSGDLIASVSSARGVAASVSTGQGTIVMAVAGASGPAGTFTKTDLKPVGSWAVAEQTGAFTYSVPLEVPPVDVGPVPSVSLSYNSAVIDGHTPASNGQSSWIADGWDMEFGYIERQYTQCTAEGFSASGLTLADNWSGFSALHAPGDFNGDGKNDLIGVKPNGEAHLFLGDGAAGLAPGVLFGSGWNSFTQIITPGDFNGDGFVDVITRTSNGDLWLYRGDGATGWLGSGAGTKIGTGWNGYVEVFSPGDFNGDGNPDVIGRASTGTLTIYPGNGSGTFLPPYVQIGMGFQIFSRHITPGDFTGDGKVDIIGVYPNGTSELYKGNGAGGWLSGSGFAVNGPWSSASGLVGSADLTGDGLADLVELSGGKVRVFPGAGNGHAQVSKGNDLCWQEAFGDGYTVDGSTPSLTPAERASYVLSMGGATYQLLPVGNNTFKTSSDTGIVVERKNRGPSTNGDDDGEYFRVWTPGGEVFYFGYGNSGSADTNSVATVQHWANDGGPSCVGTCQQAYRWMLDIQVDSALNAMFLTYEKESNRYAQSGSTAYNTYTSAIYPKTIEYGGRFDGSWDAPEVHDPTARVDFVLTGRCVENTIIDHSRAALTGGKIAGCPAPTSAATSFPDVPSDLICTASCSSSTQRTPVFFKQQRLARVDTSVWDGATWSRVASHTLYSTFPLPAGADGRTLWLDGVFTRYLGSETGPDPQADDLVTYAITFDGELLNNRVDWTTDAGKLQKRRITGVRNEFGGYVEVNYDRQSTPGTAGGACTVNGRPNAKPSDSASATWYRDNYWECFRAKGPDGNYGVYHRYLVSSIDLIDTVGGQPTQTFTFDYSHTESPRSLWVYADALGSSRNPSNVDAQEFGIFVGYPVVTVATGQGATASSTVTYYHQGRNGTWDGTSVNAADGVDAHVDLPGSLVDPVDLAALRGMPAMVEARDALGRVVTRSVFEYNVIDVVDGPHSHDSTVVQTPLVTSTRFEYVDGVTQSRTSSVSTTYDNGGADGRAPYPWLVVETLSTPDDTQVGVNTSRTVVEFSLDDPEYLGTSSWSPSEPAPFFHLPVKGASYFDAGSGEVLTGEWETSYLERNSEAGGSPSAPVVRGFATVERTRVTSGEGGQAWLESSASYDHRGRVISARGPAETVNDTEVLWAYSQDGPLRKISVTNQLGWVTNQWVEPSFGNIVKTQDANGDLTHYKYDVGGLLTGVWAPLDNARELDGNLSDAPDGSVPASAYFVYDVYTTGLATRTAPVVTLSAQYVSLTAEGNWVSLPQSSTVRRSYEFLDGFGRPVETHGVAGDGSGGRVVTQTEYDDVGRAVRVSDPYVDGTHSAQAGNGLHNGSWATIPRYSETTFDPSGRVGSTAMHVIEDGSQARVDLTSVEYALDSVTTTQVSTGAVSVLTSDSLGRMVSQTQYAEAGKGGGHIQTTYEYTVDADGTMVTVRDHEGNETVFVSDLGGRKVGLTDPNSGLSTYSYNAAGQVSEVASETGAVTFAYDALGRMTSRTALDGDAVASSGAAWVYDPVGHKGALASESATTVTPVGAFVVTQTPSYDQWHRLLGNTVTLPVSTLLGELSGISYSTAIGYDDAGVAVSLTHPSIGGLASQTVVTERDLLGRAYATSVVEVPGTRTLVTDTAFDALGRLTGRVYGNGVERGYTWDERWGALEGSAAWFESASGNVLVQADEYHRDAAGRVTQFDDNIRGVAQCNVFDGFNRLEAAWADAGINPCVGGVSSAVAPAGSEAELGFATSYNYSPSGRIVAIGQIISGATATYEYADVAHPHAATSVQQDIPIDVDPLNPGNESTQTYLEEFTYDTAGRMVAHLDGDATTDYVWDVSSNLVASSGRGGDRVYVYDAGGQRILQLTVGYLDSPAPATATAYFDGTDVTDSDAVNPGGLNATRYFVAGGTTVATASASGTEAVAWQLLLGDVQGSATISMELEVGDTSTGFESADVAHHVSRNAYLPYGARRSTDELSIDRGWLGQYEDSDTGLTYLNARYYNPVLGRFLSPDPLMNPGDPRTLDPYRYADNNPVSFTDASGLSPACVGLGLECWSAYALTKTTGALRDAHQAVVTSAKLGKAVTVSQALAHGAASTIRGAALGFVEKVNRANRASQDQALYQSQKMNGWHVAWGTIKGTAYTYFLEDADNCRKNPNLVDCGLAIVGLIPGVGKVEKLKYVDDAIDALNGVENASAPVLPAALRGGRNAEENVVVYRGFDDAGLDNYTGITSNIANRTRQHGERFSTVEVMGAGLTRGQARAIEQARIVDNMRSNKINSISPHHPYYEEAVAWGRYWLSQNPPLG